jgi:hypothetical protein
MSSAVAQNRLPLPVVVVALRRVRRDGKKHRLESHCAATLELVDRVVDVQGRHLCRGDQPRRVVHDRFLGPVVGGPHRLAQQLRCAKRARPHAQRGEHQFGPDAFVVEVGEPSAYVAGAGGSDRGLHELLLGDAGQAPPEHLSVDADGLPAAVGIPFAARHQVGQAPRQPRAPQVLGLDEVRVARVGPQLGGMQLGGRGHVRILESRSNTVNVSFGRR